MSSSGFTPREEVDESIRKRRDNSTQVLQRLDNLHNAIERFSAWSDEADRLQSAEEPLKSRMALPAGIAVETTLRDRYTLERELGEWADRVARRDPDAELELEHLRDIVATVDGTIDDATDPSQMGKSVRAAVAILQEYGAKQMLLARAFERRELSSEDLARRVVRTSQVAREAVSHEVERCQRSTPAITKTSAVVESMRSRIHPRGELPPRARMPRKPVRRVKPRHAEGSDDPEGAEVALRHDEMAAQLAAAQAAERSSASLVKDLEHANATLHKRLAAAEDECDGMRHQITRLKVLLTQGQESQLQSGSRATVAVQVSGTVGSKPTTWLRSATGRASTAALRCLSVTAP
jgi:hypothetical protein